jgi:hypothetical protein
VKRKVTDEFLSEMAKDLNDLSKLQRLWRSLKDSEDVVLPEDGRYYQGLHRKIMSALNEEVKSTAALSAVVIQSQLKSQIKDSGGGLREKRRSASRKRVSSKDNKPN